MILDVNDRFEGDEFGAVDNGDFRDHSVRISSLISAKFEGKETFVGFANGDLKVALFPFDFQLQSGLSLLRLFLQKEKINFKNISFLGLQN